jgi:hypothetical protein
MKKAIPFALVLCLITIFIWKVFIESKNDIDIANIPKAEIVYSDEAGFMGPPTIVLIDIEGVLYYPAAGAELLLETNRIDTNTIKENIIAYRTMEFDWIKCFSSINDMPDGWIIEFGNKPYIKKFGNQMQLYKRADADTPEWLSEYWKTQVESGLEKELVIPLCDLYDDASSSL